MTELEKLGAVDEVIEDSYCSQLLVMRRSGEITSEELRNECAMLILNTPAMLEDLKPHAFPTKSKLIQQLCEKAPRTRSKEIEERATSEQVVEVNIYCESFMQVKNMNYSNYMSLCEMRDVCLDPKDKERYEEFIEQHFTPLREVVHKKPWDVDYPQGGNRWKGYKDVLFIGTVIGIQGGLF